MCKHYNNVTRWSLNIPKRSHHLTLQLLSSLWSFTVRFSCPEYHFTVSVYSHRSHRLLYTLSTKQQTLTVRS